MKTASFEIFIIKIPDADDVCPK